MPRLFASSLHARLYDLHVLVWDKEAKETRAMLGQLKTKNTQLGSHQGPQVSSRTLYRSQGHQAPQPCRPGLLLEIIDFDIAMQVKDEDEDEEVDDRCGTKR
jgi:hypothetical protein